MEWLWLLLAILFEVTGTTSLKYSDGYTKLLPSVVTVFCYIACFFALGMALKKLDMGLAYAIWGAVGIALISAIGIIFFGESMTPLRIICFILIIIGTVGLKLS